MTFAQRMAMVFGWAFIAVGLLGFAATGASMDPNHLTAPWLLGIFPVNVVHNIVHLLFGAWGVIAARSFGGARSYLLGAGVVYLLLAALGFVAPNGFGLVPLGGNDIGLHVFLALGLLLSGLVSRAPAATADGTPRTTV